MPAPDYRHEARVEFEAARLPEFADVYARVRGAVGEETWADVERLLELSQRYGHDWERRVVYGMIDGIARHFPGQAPAIRAVGQHVFEAAQPGECGVVLDDRLPTDWHEPCLRPTPAPAERRSA